MINSAYRIRAFSVTLGNSVCCCQVQEEHVLNTSSLKHSLHAHVVFRDITFPSDTPTIAWSLNVPSTGLSCLYLLSTYVLFSQTLHLSHSNTQFGCQLN